MVSFDEAMLSHDRTVVIRVGKYGVQQIKEATFDYSYIAGDTFKPGSTCTSTATIVFTQIIETFRPEQVLVPEIGLLVNGQFEWVKMGMFYINDISLDRNRNTTQIELIDGMFKLNQSYQSNLKFPATIKDIISEIATKIGINLASNDLGVEAMRYTVAAMPNDKDVTFRDVLSQVTQVLGFSCFFNRNGQLEIRGLLDSGVTITADNYFMHGLSKSELEYSIAGIVCKKGNETLTTGLRVGRTLEIENPFMTQMYLGNLYERIKDVIYYPYTLNYQGHLKLDVGQWVTIVTNKNERYKVPVLHQSFKFSGGLSSQISADSTASNDTQFSYKGSLKKMIQQMGNTVDAELRQQHAYFDGKFEEHKQEVDTSIAQAKSRAEAIKQELDNTIETKINQSKTQLSQQLNQSFVEKLNAKSTEIGNLINQRIETVRTALNDKVDTATFTQKSNELTQSVTALSGQVLKKSEISITNNAITLGSGKVINGQTLSSVLVTQPEAITAITNKMVISNTQLNLVQPDYRSYVTLNNRYMFVSDLLTDPLVNGDEFLVSCGWAIREVTGVAPNVNIGVKITYVDKTEEWWHGKVFLRETGKHTYSYKVDMLATNKRVLNYRFYILQDTHDNFSTWKIAALSIVRKSSAELIVDGTITSKHIKTNSITTGHLQVGSVTGTIIKADAVEGKHINFDTAFIDKITTSDLFVRQLFASRATIAQLESITIDASQVTSGILRSKNGATLFNLQTGALDFETNNSVIRRISAGTPTQFIKLRKHSNGISSTIIGSNRENTEDENDGYFVGIRIYNGYFNEGSSTFLGTNYQDAINIVSDNLTFTHSADGTARGWRVITSLPNKSEISLEPLNFSAGYKSSIFAHDFLFAKNTKNASVSLIALLKELSLTVTHIVNGGFSDDTLNALRELDKKIERMKVW